MIQFTWYQFKDLTADQLYRSLMLRSSVFIMEQNCVCLDPDGRDVFASHLLGLDQDNQLAAYLRLFPPTDIENFIVFGRVVTARSSRAKGYGKKLMKELLAYCEQYYPNITIRCSAQSYLIKFYESFGFKTLGEIYQEDAIPHIAMEKHA